MPDSEESKLLTSIHSIEFMAPYPLETALAYPGNSRWLGVYWESELNQFCYSDGQLVGTGSNQGWQLFRTHRHVSPLLKQYHFADDGQPAQHYLLLDRKTRRLYVGEGALIEACLKQPPLLALLAAIKANCAVTAENGYQFQLKWGAYRTRTMIISSALLLLLGLPAIGFGTAVMAEKMDWLELPEWLD